MSMTGHSLLWGFVTRAAVGGSRVDKPLGDVAIARGHHDIARLSRLRIFSGVEVAT